MNRRDQQRHRRDHAHHVGQRERRHLDEGERVLAL
jgi:hypothetical protein